jgi:ribosome-binding factor A
MEEGKRQRQVAGALQEELNDIFRRLGLGMIDGGMVSISSVKVTPDLLEARIYLSLFQVKDVKATMKTIESRAWEIKKELAGRVKHQLRRIPYCISTMMILWIMCLRWKRSLRRLIKINLQEEE